MLQVSRKNHKNSVASVIHLIADYRLLIILPLILSGCMGVYEGGFECPPGEGVGCKSISEVNQMVDQSSVIRNRLSENMEQETDSFGEEDSVCGHVGSCPATSEIWYSPSFKIDPQEKRKMKVLNDAISI